jgi:hypothetical protein
MNTGAIIAGLLILLIILIWKIMRYRDKRYPVLTKGESSHLIIAAAQEVPFPNNLNETRYMANTDIMFEEVWWKKLSDLHQLQLALSLCQKALPVWDKYTASQDVTYRTSSTGPSDKIDSRILQIALEEITIHSRLHFPGKDNKRIKECYLGFVSPVVAIQDVDWIPPYPVKKIFLAVYYMLKGLVEQNNLPGLNNSLATSITQALDCLDIAKLCSREEITAFLEVFKSRL